MPMSWTAEAYARLFAAVIKTNESIKFDYAAIASYMGEDCTAKAVTHKISAMKAIANDLSTDWTPSTTGNFPNIPATPRKRSLKVANADAAGDDGDGAPAPKKARTPRTPKSKTKKATIQENPEKDPKVKPEEEDVLAATNGTTTTTVKDEFDGGIEEDGVGEE